MTLIQRNHSKKVNNISRQIKKFYKLKKKVRIYHGTTNSTRKQKFIKDQMITMSDFSEILEVNTKEKYVIVEPNVPMDMLVKATLQHGFVPPVVMEFPGITVGGGIQGGAGESSSFKYGGFHQTCLEYEMILGNGTVVTVSPRKHADLFWGTACSYGSLGIITKVKLRIIPAKKYVQLSYHRVNSFAQSITVQEEQLKERIDFIDGILFSNKLGTIMTGVFSDKKPLPIETFLKAKDDWFYTHAEKITKKYDTWQELIPIEDYLFRYNRGAFWVGKYVYTKMLTPFNRVTRFIFDPFMHTRFLYRFLHAINISQRQIIQDFCLPKKNVQSFLNYVDKKVKVYPIWLLPGFLSDKHDNLSPGYLKSELIIDVGVWGKVKGDYSHLIQLNRELEKELYKYKGRKVLYAHQYYTREEFWKIYNKKWYETLRKKYFAGEVFPDVYEKTHVAEKYNYSIIKGLLDVLKSPFSLPVTKNK